MTDRINALVVTLDHDIREDDVEAVVQAIRMIKCVLRVDTNVSNIDTHVAYERARLHMHEVLRKALMGAGPPEM